MQKQINQYKFRMFMFKTELVYCQSTVTEKYFQFLQSHDEPSFWSQTPAKPG